MFNRLKKVFKRYYCVKQFDITDCGAACLATVAKQYGLKVPITQIRQIAGTDQKGTNALGLIKAANHLCFTAKGIRLTPDELLEASDLPLPLIAHVVKDKLLHFVVIHEIDKKEILIADPAEGLVSYQPRDFFAIWSGILITLLPDEKFQKGNRTAGLFERFLHIIIPHRRLLAEIILASILLTIFGLTGTFYWKYLIDDILPDGLLNTLHIISLGMLTLNLFHIILDILRGQLLLYFSTKLNIKMVIDYFQHVMDLPLSFFDTRKVGEILSRFNDTDKIIDAISGTVFSVALDSLMVIFGGFILYFQNSTLFLITIITLPLYAIVVWSFKKPYQNINRKYMEQEAQVQSIMVESVSGAFTIKAFNGQESVKLEAEQCFIRQIKTMFRSVWLQNIQSALQSFLVVVGDLAILWIGADLVIKGTISLGQLLAFNALAGYFTEPIKNLIGLQFTLQEAYVASDRLGEILDLEIEALNEEKKVKLARLKGEIEFKKVDFRYGTRELVLNDINFKIKPQERIALVGASGSGKTTLAKLLLKYYLPEKGEILVDGYNIQDLNIESLRDRIGYVPQEIFLFSGTIRENIVFGNERATFDEIIEAAKQAQAHEFINEQPLRYETLVGERGSTLSGGQRQRIGIARAVLKKPDLLILDEATSSLDSITENMFQETLNLISQKVTTVIIAHRLSTIRRCDRIFVMEKGIIIESGSHAELLNHKGKYYELWQSQVGNPDHYHARGEHVS